MPSIELSLTGRVAVVTGGASGIGRAIALRLHGSGARVAIMDRQASATDDAIAAASELRLDVDVTDRLAMEVAAARVLADLGSAAILVNSAGIGHRVAALEHDPRLFGQLLEVNVVGMFNACQLFGRQMVAAGGGCIINISSVGALVAYAGSVGYQASKAAVSQMTRTLAVEWAPQRVRVNAVAPGHTRTPLVERLWEREPQLRDFFLSRTPAGVLANPEDMTGLVLFLASDDAAMITGQTIAVDGGFSLQ